MVAGPEFQKYPRRRSGMHVSYYGTDVLVFHKEFISISERYIYE